MSNTNQYAFLLRRGTRPVTEEESERRSQEVRTWASGHYQAGKLVLARVLADEARSTTGQVNDDSVGAVLFFQAEDIESALALANTWPGIAYGGSVEVRPSTDPTANAGN